MLSYARAIGANTDFISAQAFVFPREGDDEKLFVALITGIGEDSFATIRKTGLDLEEKFFSEGGVGESFEAVIHLLKNELSKLEQFSAVVGFLEKETLYIETINNFNVLLLRKNQLTELTRGLESEKLISGMIQPEDRVLFLSPSLTDEESEQRKILEGNLLNSSLENLEFEIESFLQGFQKPDPVASVLVISTPKEDEEPEIEQPYHQPQINPEPRIINPFEAESSSPRVMPIRLDGARVKTPPVLLLLDSLIQRISLPEVSKKRLILIVGLALLGLFIVGNIFIRQLDQNSKFDSKVKESEQKLNQALAVKDANPQQSKAFLAEAKLNLKDAQAINPDGVSQLEQRVNEASFQILKQYEQKEFPIFLDLNLIKENFNASRMSTSFGRIAALDTNSKSLVAIEIAQKQPQILAGSFQLGDVQFASINGDHVYTFSKDKGISKIDAGNSRATIEVPPDSQWQRVVDIYAFANNVYLLDEFKNQIWKYIATEDGFAERTGYIREGESVDFAAARVMHIDGMIWILRSENTIIRLVQGGVDHFQLGEIDPPLDTIKSFYLSDETENLYLLDNENSRVVITNKQGEYQSQYMGEKFKTASDLVVDEKDKKLYLLEGGKIYQIDLK